jgi:hypothetical protein
LLFTILVVTNRIKLEKTSFLLFHLNQRKPLIFKMWQIKAKFPISITEVEGGRKPESPTGRWQGVKQSSKLKKKQKRYINYTTNSSVVRWMANWNNKLFTFTKASLSKLSEGENITLKKYAASK